MLRLAAMKTGLRERARGIWRIVLDTGGGEGEGEGNESSEEQGVEREIRQSEETNVRTPLTTPNDTRKQSRSRSWLPGILVRKATGDDIEAPILPPRVEMNEVPRNALPRNGSSQFTMR